VNKLLLQSTLLKQGVRFQDVAKFLGITKTSFSRKIKDNTFSLKEVEAIGNKYSIPKKDLADIFFGK
jgi:predicted transcriptional regulator